MLYAEKRVYAGDMLDIDIFPEWKRGQGKRNPSKGTSNSQKKLNERNKIKKFIQLINANFKANVDIVIHVGYSGMFNPDIKQMDKDIDNYIRRLRYAMKKRGWGDLKAVIVREYDEASQKKKHAHIICNFPDRDLAEQLWGKCDYPNARRLKSNDFGLTGLAVYLKKDPRGKKSYKATRNLYKPYNYPKYNKTRYGRGKKVRMLSTQFEDPKTHFEKIHPSYKFLDMQTYISDSGDVFLYARMHKKHTA
ncbi:MAG: hypothetical protein R3Y18_00115 [Bacillota bacterium]